LTLVQVSSEAAASTAPQQLYLDDLHVGQRFTSGAHRLDESQIKAFARQFDPQPFHTDEHAAERTFFKGLAASGWHTAAITMRLNAESGSATRRRLRRRRGRAELVGTDPTRRRTPC